MASSRRLEPRPLQDCNTMNARVQWKSTENKESRQFCKSWRWPGASTTCPSHRTTFNIDGSSELIIAGFENSNACVGWNPNKMVTNLNWACASACAYSTDLRNVSITPSNYPREITFSCWQKLVEMVFNIRSVFISISNQTIDGYLQGVFKSLGLVAFKTST